MMADGDDGRCPSSLTNEKSELSNGCASRVGLTPAPTCLPGQGGSRKGMRPFGNETGRTIVSPPRSNRWRFFFMSDTTASLPNERETPFVDPWSKKPNHQGVVPVDALFVGAWDNDLGIDNINEALFLVRDDRQDLLWSLTTYSEKTTRENLDARESGDPAWMKSEITCGCVAGAPREGTQSKAATRLLDALVRARVHHEFPRPPYLPGLLTIAELADIVRAVTEELERNALAAETAQRGHEAPIIKLASELGLDPRPAGHNDTAWMADCPSRSHTIMLSPSLNEFGCGYCRRKGGPAELRAFADYVKSLWASE